MSGKDWNRENWKASADTQTRESRKAEGPLYFNKPVMPPNGYNSHKCTFGIQLWTNGVGTGTVNRESAKK